MSGDEIIVPLVEETVTVGRRKRATGTVHVRVSTAERAEDVAVDLTEERVEVERVPIGRFVEDPPGIRSEGDTTIIPVLEERAVVTVRWFLREEVRVRTVRHSRTEQRAVSLRTETAEVERTAISEGVDET